MSRFRGKRYGTVGSEVEFPSAMKDWEGTGRVNLALRCSNDAAVSCSEGNHYAGVPDEQSSGASQGRSNSDVEKSFLFAHNNGQMMFKICADEKTYLGYAAHARGKRSRASLFLSGEIIFVSHSSCLV
jgi:hypothetical protein